MPLTSSMEDYLEAVLVLQQQKLNITSRMNWQEF